jgi:hypothetical protein
LSRIEPMLMEAGGMVVGEEIEIGLEIEAIMK